MNDRSVRAKEIRQSAVVPGDNNIVSLRFGDTDIVLSLKRKQLPRPERRRRLGPDDGPHELAILIPEAGKLPFVGRQDLLAEFRAWLNDEPNISVHALIGRAGTGKTRLALELCRAIDSDPTAKGEWLAGFISPCDLSTVVETLATQSFTWERPTLLVIDYAAQCHLALARWLDRLVYQTLDSKLRILLLDRAAPEGFGWWHDLTSPGLRSDQARLDLFHALRPRHLPDLSALDQRRELIAAALRAACAVRPAPPLAPNIPAAGDDADFDTRLADRQFGNPLSLVMAGVIARDRGPRAALALRHLDAARQFGRRELDRLAALAESRGLNGDTMRYIVAFNGLAGGLPSAGLRKTLADELAASQRSTNLDVLLSLLEQELPSPVESETPVQQKRLSTIQPDLIGEAAIIEAFTGQASRQAEEGLAAVCRAYALGPDTAAQALVRLTQDFAYALEDQSATQAEKATGKRVMTWLTTLARNMEDPVQLIPLVEALPTETTVLREAAVEFTERLAAFFRQVADRSHDWVDIFNAAMWVNNLAIRMSDLGRREDALAAAEEAVRLNRALAEARLDAFTLTLALSLNNLANRLSDLGRREDALAAAEEAVRLCRALVEARPDANTPDLARSLHTLAERLSDLGRSEDALAAAEEAVRLRRALVTARPGAFTPALAESLGNLSNYLIDLGRREDALAAAEEAVSIYRALAEARPDAFIPHLANSLNGLAISLSNLGRREDALAAAEEAVRHRRALATARPGAFSFHLAESLNNLANYLSDLGRRKEALAAAEEAVSIYRALAEARPDPDKPNLASSLNTLANRLSDLGRREERRSPRPKKRSVSSAHLLMPARKPLRRV